MNNKIRENKLPSFVKYIVVITAVLAISACGAPKIKQTVLMPAKASAMKNSKKVAVVGFYGDREEIFTKKLQSYVSGITVQGQRYFQVIDHSMLKASLQQQFAPPSVNIPDPADLADLPNPGDLLSSLADLASSAPGLNKRNKKSRKAENKAAKAAAPGLPTVDAPSYIFRPADAMKIGQISGADTIMTGIVKWPGIVATKETEERSRCAEHKKRKSDNKLTPGYKGSKCTRYEKYAVNCTTQTSKIDFALKAVSIASSEIAFTKEYTGKAENKYCDDEKDPTIATAADLSDKAIANAFTALRQDLAPYNVVVTIELMDSDNSQLSANKEIQKLLENGLDFAKNGRFDRACENFKQVETQYDKSPAVYYNLGVCAEVMNELSLASTLYKRADGLTTKNNDTINQALSRVDARIARSSQLESQLR